MALPTTNLTLHCDASDTDNLFTTADTSAGNHSGTPSDGGSVAVWDDEDDGVSDVCFATGPSPVYRSSTPLMNLPCLDFNGSDQVAGTRNQTATVNKAVGDFITASAYTLLIAFYAEAASTDSSNTYANHGIVADADGFMGLYLRNTGGTTPTVYAYNWDGSDDSVGSAVSLNTSYVAMVRHESGTLYLSLNGGSESSVASGDTQTLTARLFLGLGNSQYFSGRIGELAIWNAALTGTDLTDAIDYFTDKWLTTPAPAYTQAAFRWRLNDGGLGAP